MLSTGHPEAVAQESTAETTDVQQLLKARNIISCFCYPGEEGKREISLQGNLHAGQAHLQNYIRTEEFWFYLNEVRIRTSSFTQTVKPCV